MAFLLNDFGDLRLQTLLGLTTGLNPLGPAAEHHGPRKEGRLIWCPSLFLLWDSGVGRQPVFHYYLGTAKAWPWNLAGTCGAAVSAACLGWCRTAGKCP